MKRKSDLGQPCFKWYFIHFWGSLNMHHFSWRSIKWLEFSFRSSQTFQIFAYPFFRRFKKPWKNNPLLLARYYSKTRLWMPMRRMLMKLTYSRIWLYRTLSSLMLTKIKLHCPKCYNSPIHQSTKTNLLLLV